MKLNFNFNQENFKLHKIRIDWRNARRELSRSEAFGGGIIWSMKVPGPLSLLRVAQDQECENFG
jgi:hypothetical protein